MTQSTTAGLTRYHGRIFLPIYFVFLGVLALFTFAAAGKADEDRSSSGKTSSPAVSPPGVSEQSFHALINARDDKLEFAAELKQIISYHGKLRVALDKLLNALSGVYAATYVTTINNELARLKKLEDALDREGDVKAKQDSAKEFGKNFPPFLSESDVVSNAQLVPDSNPIAFASKEYIGATAIFDNVSSFENKEVFNKYRKIFDAMQSFGSSDEKKPLSEALPGEFLKLTGANSYDTLTEPQIKSAVSKYREVLKAALDQISASTISSGTTFITNVRKQADDVGMGLENRSKALKRETDDLAGDVTSTAKSMYGHTVSESSFYYLLLLFAVVFLAIMVIPRFYPTPVAQNVLRSDFILQFSTVFVLIAAIIILSIGGFIAPDQVPVLLAGISGYVLGQLGSNQGRSAPSTPPPASPP
jgi:hypothetical protein